MVTLGRPKELTKINGKSVYLQWINEPFITPDGKHMPIGVKGFTIYMVWNKDLKYVNPEVINFVLWHEIGHIVLGHSEKIGPRNTDDENAADAFALSVMGNKFSKEDVATFCRWFGSTCGKLHRITSDYLETQYKRFGL